MKNVLIFSLFLAICLITACNSEDSENSESQNDASTDASDTSDTSDTSDATSTDAGNQIPKTCEDEKTPSGNAYLGYKECASGALHRVEALECEKGNYAEKWSCKPEYFPEADDLSFLQCQTDSDCTEKSNGKCVYQGDPDPNCFCWYECLKDSDCENNEICFCSPANSCKPANCKTDADCNGDFCAISFVSAGDNPRMRPQLYCHTPNDECQGDSDCQDARTGNMCSYDSNAEHWICIYYED